MGDLGGLGSILVDSDTDLDDSLDLSYLPVCPSVSQLLDIEFNKHPRLLNAAHLNAESVVSHRDDLADIFASRTCHVIMISESFLKPTLPDAMASISGYKLIRNDRVGKRCGGVAMYLREDIKFKVLHVSDPQYSSKPEMLFVEARFLQARILLGAIYRPPNAGCLNNIEQVLSELAPEYDHKLIMGDLNADWGQDSGDTRQLKNIFDLFELSVVPSGPTCHVKNARIDSHTTLDLTVTNADRVVNSGQFSVPYISIHDLIYVTYSIRTPKFKPKFIQRRDFKNLNLIELQRNAELTDWEEIRDVGNMDRKIELFNSKILTLYDELAPLEKKRVTRPANPWLDETIKRLQKNRDKTLRNFKITGTAEAQGLYKRARNKLKQEIRNAKRRFLIR